MRNLRDALLNSRIYSRCLILVAVLSTLAALAPLSTATAPVLTMNVINNSGREIRHLYLAPPNSDDWGPDQLNGSISPGTSRSLNVTWNQSAVKLVAEDQDGCFMETTVEAAGSPAWTIASDTPRNCGE